MWLLQSRARPRLSCTSTTSIKVTRNNKCEPEIDVCFHLKHYQMSGAGNCSCFNVCSLFIVEDENSCFAFAPGFGSFQPRGFLAEKSLEDVRGDFCVSVGAPGPGVRGCCGSEPWGPPPALQELWAGWDVPIRSFPPALPQLCCAGVAPLSPLPGGLRQCRHSLL